MTALHAFPGHFPTTLILETSNPFTVSISFPDLIVKTVDTPLSLIISFNFYFSMKSPFIGKF